MILKVAAPGVMSQQNATFFVAMVRHQNGGQSHDGAVPLIILLVFPLARSMTK